MIYKKQAEYEKAEQQYERALQIMENHWRILNTRIIFAFVHLFVVINPISAVDVLSSSSSSSSETETWNAGGKDYASISFESFKVCPLRFSDCFIFVNHHDY